MEKRRAPASLIINRGADGAKNRPPRVKEGNVIAVLGPLANSNAEDVGMRPVGMSEGIFWLCWNVMHV